MIVIPKRIEVCECSYEGIIEVFIPTINRCLKTTYTSRNEPDIRENYPLNEEINTQLIIEFGKITPTTEEVKKIGESIVGIYKGKMVIDDSVFYIIESEVEFLCENELGKFKEPEKLNQWINVSGEIQLLRLNER